jgi:hypothetical protein
MNIATTLRWFLMHACWHPKFRSSADQERLQHCAAEKRGQVVGCWRCF